MKNDRRSFFVYDLELASRKEGARVPLFGEALAVWHKMWKAGKTYPLNNDKATLLIGDMVIDEPKSTVAMLVRLSDTAAPNSVYSDPVNGGYVEHEKAGTVGADFACHVLISSAPEAAQPNVYTCAIERVTGINANLIQRLLSKLLNYEFNANDDFYRYPSPGGGLTRDGRPRTDRCCPHVELRGRPSASMVKDINEGRLTGVSLVRSEAVTPIDGAPYLTKSYSELKLDIDHKSLPKQLWGSLEKMMMTYSDAYGVAKVSYKRAGSGRVVTVELNAETAQPLSDLYVESFEVTAIFPPLAHSSKSVVKRLIDPAASSFVAYRSI